MPLTNAPLEKIWDELLSQDPSQIQRTFTSLDAQSQNNILLHLQRMVNETGWLPVQKRSAQIALDVLLNNAVDNDQSQE